jgi:hypothetical protein
MALINTTTTGVLGSTFYADGSGDLTIQQNGVLINKITSNGLTYRGTGSVLQVLSVTKTDSFSTTASVFTDVTGLSVSITPTSSTSKILVMLSMSLAGQNGNGGAIYKFVRGSTDICVGDLAGSRQQASGGAPYIGDANVYNTISGSFLDSPATTSSTTYKIQVVGANAGGGVYVNRTQNDTNASNFYNSRTASTITVMEIAV